MTANEPQPELKIRINYSVTRLVARLRRKRNISTDDSLRDEKVKGTSKADVIESLLLILYVGKRALA
jgi:hypothetical protein